MGTATATGIGVSAVRPVCWARAVASEVEVSSPSGLSGGSLDPPFEGSDVVVDGCVAAPLADPLLTLLPAPAFALEGGPGFALLLASLFVGWLSAEYAVGAALFAGVTFSSERRGRCACGGGPLLPAFSLTSAPKTSFAGARSARGDQYGAA